MTIARSPGVRPLIAAMVIGAIVLLSWDKLSWRVRLLSLHLSEDLPHIGWTQVALSLLPHSLVRDPVARQPRTLVVGNVQLLRFEADSAPCAALWSTPVGPFWGRLSDEIVLEIMIDEQPADGPTVYENDFVSVEEGDVVLDVGGHLGVFTRHALDAGASKVLVFEPEPITAECFRKTFREDIRAGRVVHLEQAAYEREGMLKFQGTDPNLPHSWYASVGARISKQGDIMVRAVTIDQAARNLDAVDFIKMDIEGGERHALRGAVETLARFKPRLAICVYHRDDDPRVIPEIILAAQPAYEQRTGREQHYFR